MVHGYASVAYVSKPMYHEDGTRPKVDVRTPQEASIQDRKVSRWWAYSSLGRESIIKRYPIRTGQSEKVHLVWSLPTSRLVSARAASRRTTRALRVSMTHSVGSSQVPG